VKIVDCHPGARVRVRRFAHRTLDNAGVILRVEFGRKVAVRLDCGKVVTVASQRVQPMRPPHAQDARKQLTGDAGHR